MTRPEWKHHARLYFVIGPDLSVSGCLRRNILGVRNLHDLSIEEPFLDPRISFRADKPGRNRRPSERPIKMSHMEKLRVFAELLPEC
jgi:hypothetical protein